MGVHQIVKGLSNCKSFWIRLAQFDAKDSIHLYITKQQQQQQQQQQKENVCNQQQQQQQHRRRGAV